MQAGPEPAAYSDKQLDALALKTEAVERRLDRAHEHETKDRSFVTRLVVCGFGVCVVLVFIVITIGAWQTGQWREAGMTATEILKTVVFPVVTLILGYYFGRASGP